VNKSNAVVGSYVNSSSATVGFWYAGGKYTNLNYPGAAGFTRALGINDSNKIVGDYLDGSNRYHGYTYTTGGGYTTYDYNQTESSGLFGISSAGDYVGSVGNSGEPERAFTDVGGVKHDFYASGTDVTYGYAINKSNVIVGVYTDSGNLQHGFSANADGTNIQEIKYPGATRTFCLGINDAGEITGTYTTASVQYGFTYNTKTKVFASTDFTATTGVNSAGAYSGTYYGVDGVTAGYLAQPQAFKLSEVVIPNDQRAVFWGVNNTGVAVGTYVDSGGTRHGLMYSAGTVSNIDDPNGPTILLGINSSNQIVGHYFDGSGNPHGFEYVSGTFTEVPGPSGALSSDAFGINDAGEIVGDYYASDGHHHGFVLKGGTYTTLDVPGATDTYGAGINAGGLVTFFWVDSVGYTQSSLYDGTKYTSINVPGAALTVAHGINKAGNIVFAWYDNYLGEHGALKKGSTYTIFDFPQGSNASANGINDGGVIVGSFIPAGQTNPQPFQSATTIASFSPTSGPVGTSVTIKGTAFSGTTKVTFNGTSATFTVNSETQITATVPTGATTGKIKVTVDGVTVTSSQTFTVT
jgi:hypothetical protein